LFGTSTPTPPPPSHQRSSTLTQAALHNSSVLSTSTSSSGGALGEQRRLAEFATILGDYKLATNVWETLRKDGKGGSDIIPILVAAGPGVQLHAQHALSSLASSAQSEETPPHVLFAALRYTARWVESIPLEDFISDVLEGERWLVWAAGNVGLLSSLQSRSLTCNSSGRRCSFRDPVSTRCPSQYSQEIKTKSILAVFDCSKPAREMWDCEFDNQPDGICYSEVYRNP
jgi:hypothetical protein